LESYSSVARVALALALLLAAASAAPAPGANGKLPDCQTLFDTAWPTRAARPGEVELTAAYSASPSAAGSRVTWTLRLRNRTGTRLGLSFPTSQYANVIVRRGGRLVYSWHFRRVFFQAFTGRTLEPGETYVCRLAPDALELEPGRYEVIAYLSTYRLRVFKRHSLLVNG
jgi:hypothetical protein